MDKRVTNLINGDARHIALADESVQCIITSPPYWGLRDYGTATWQGGDPKCEHSPADTPTRRGLASSTLGGGKETTGHQREGYGAVCRRCGARRIDSQIGLEAQPDCLGWATGQPCGSCYVCHIVAVMRECWRVLRSDGVCWLNLGDSYAANRGTGDSPLMGAKQKTNVGSHLGRLIVPDGLKPKDLCLIPSRVALALQANGWYVRSEIIWHKCLSGGAVVYARTQKGDMPMTVKDMVRLNPATVKLWDGEKWNQIVAWGSVAGDADRKKKSQRARQAKYRGNPQPVAGDIEIEFRNGERVGCTREHRWPTHRGIIEAADLVIGDVIPVVSLPEPSDPKMPANLDDSDTGWLVGMYLAEGSRSADTLQFAGNLKEVERNHRLQRIAESFHGHCAVHQTSENGLTANINGPMLVSLVDTYISGRTAKDKHLHPRCWERSNAFLRSLLQGYLEGDGGQRVNGSWRLGFTSNDALVSDLRTIAARLGASLRLRRGIATDTTTGKQYKCWRGDIVMQASDRRNCDGEIIAIRQSRARKFWNISLADNPHTFSLASGITTKNSNPMPESVTDRPTKAHEMIYLLTKRAGYYYDNEAIKEPIGEWSQKALEGRWHRKSNAKLYGDGKNNRLDQSPTYMSGADYGGNIDANGRNRRSVWTVATSPYSGAHFATFPPALVEPMILAGTSQRGACPTCGKAWVRVVDRSESSWQDRKAAGHVSNLGGSIKLQKANGATYDFDNSSGGFGTPATSVTIGFAPACACYAAPPLPDVPICPMCGGDGKARINGEDVGYCLVCNGTGWSPLEQIERARLLNDVYPLLPVVPCKVFDPFSGSGTVLRVAIKHGRIGIGNDLNLNYAPLAVDRTSSIQRVMPL